MSEWSREIGYEHGSGSIRMNVKWNPTYLYPPGSPSYQIERTIDPETSGSPTHPLHPVPTIPPHFLRIHLSPPVNRPRMASVRSVKVPNPLSNSPERNLTVVRNSPHPNCFPCNLLSREAIGKATGLITTKRQYERAVVGRRDLQWRFGCTSESFFVKWDRGACCPWLNGRFLVNALR